MEAVYRIIGCIEPADPAAVQYSRFVVGWLGRCPGRTELRYHIKMQLKVLLYNDEWEKEERERGRKKKKERGERERKTQRKTERNLCCTALSENKCPLCRTTRFPSVFLLTTEPQLIVPVAPWPVSQSRQVQEREGHSSQVSPLSCSRAQTTIVAWSKAHCHRLNMYIHIYIYIYPMSYSLSYIISLSYLFICYI